MLKATAKKADIYSAYKELNHTNEELQKEQRILFVIAGLLLITHML